MQYSVFLYHCLTESRFSIVAGQWRGTHTPHGASRCVAQTHHLDLLFALLSHAFFTQDKTLLQGWLSWEKFRCNVHCSHDPANCISERLFMETADSMIADGFRDAGYEFVIIDDCWLAKERDEGGKLQPDPDRFPTGMTAFGRYLHKRCGIHVLANNPCPWNLRVMVSDGRSMCGRRKLKFGIYGDIGTKTCGGYPGMAAHLKQDAQTYADWGVDYLKVDSYLGQVSFLASLYKS